MGGGGDFEAVTLVVEKASTHLRTAIKIDSNFGSHLRPPINGVLAQGLAIAFKKRRAYIRSARQPWRVGR